MYEHTANGVFLDDTAYLALPARFLPPSSAKKAYQLSDTSRPTVLTGYGGSFPDEASKNAINRIHHLSYFKLPLQIAKFFTKPETILIFLLLL